MITIFSTILGTILGFFSAWLLFYIKERAKDRREKIVLANLLKRELEYNIKLIDDWIKDIRKDLNFLKWKNPIYIFSARYDLFQNNFINKAFQAGIIYDLLDNEQINIISEISTFFTIDRKKFILEVIKNNKDVDVVYIDDEGVPTTGKDYIYMWLEDELTINKKMQNDIKEILPLLKYDESELSKIIKRAICSLQQCVKRDN